MSNSHPRSDIHRLGKKASMINNHFSDAPIYGVVKKPISVMK